MKYARSIVLCLVVIGGVLQIPGSVALAASVMSTGPLTRIEISPDLNCAVNHAGDASGEFFGDTACATLVAAGGTLYGPTSIPAGDNAAPRIQFTPVSQSAVTGTGTSADPFQIVTVVDLGTSGLRITETDSYVTGEESYRTDVAVSNTSESGQTAILYRAGDCFLQGSDRGFGSVEAGTGAVSCVAGVEDSPGHFVPGTRIEQWFPLSSGSHYYEDVYSSVWARIGSQQPFADSCAACATYVDNGAGLSWDLSLPAGGSVTRSHLTVFSPLGRVPLTTSKTADSATADPGGADGYTITIHNDNTTAVTLDQVTDTLPTGFTYTPGSSSGATTADPSITGQDLAWAGPISVPAHGDISIHFDVTVSSAPGEYFNNAGGQAEGFTVAPTGDTAKITVGTTQHTLTVTNPSSGSGTITFSYDETSTGCALTASTGSGPSCSKTFDTGTMVTLSASAASGSTFSGWSGEGCTGTETCTLTMEADRSVTASFERVPSADLSITKSDTASGDGPDPVSSGDVVAYMLSVTNNGPDAAHGISVTDTSSMGGTIVGASGTTSGTNWSCSITTTTSATCTRSTALASGGTADPIRIEVRAPTTSAGTSISDSATVSGVESDPVPTNNTDAEPTAVSPSGTRDTAAGFCGGATPCNISTDPGTGATKTDPTVSIFTIPNEATADPQTITLTELPGSTGNICGGQPCQGQVVDITSSATPTFSGVDDPHHPAVLTMIFDKTVKQGTKIYVKKGTVISVVRNCTTPGIAAPRPCVSEKNILLSNGDREFKILFLAGDPIIGKH